MIHLRQPNRWTCLPTSFAMVLGTSLARIFELVGHDGSDIWFPELSEPNRRRGFHLQEMVSAAFSLGKSVIEIEAHPTFLERPIYNEPDVRMERFMLHNDGVLAGAGRYNMHAVAWQCKFQRVLDPNGTSYKLGDSDSFTPSHFFLVR